MLLIDHIVTLYSFTIACTAPSILELHFLIMLMAQIHNNIWLSPTSHCLFKQSLASLDIMGALQHTISADMIKVKFYPLQNMVAKIYRYLHLQQERLGFYLGDVKSSIKLSPLAPAQLAEPFQRSFFSALQSVGWTSLAGNHLLSCNYLLAAAGKVEECFSLHLEEVIVAFPRSILLIVNPGIFSSRSAKFQTYILHIVHVKTFSDFHHQ